MTLQACYEALGGDYQEVMGRLRSERMVQKFVLKFVDDGSYALLKSSVASGDYQEAFRASHTIKGVCQNLSFRKLQESSTRLTEALRGGSWNEEAAGLLAQVDADYQQTVQAIRSFQAGLA